MSESTDLTNSTHVHSSDDGIIPTEIVPKKDQAVAINIRSYRKLPGAEVLFNSLDRGPPEFDRDEIKSKLADVQVCEGWL